MSKSKVVVDQNAKEIKVVDEQEKAQTIQLTDQERVSGDSQHKDVLVLKRYESSIGYYWKASRSNKRYYKQISTWTVILGAIVTLVSSVAAGLTGDSTFALFLRIATPILAAALTIVSGFSQTFQWGPTWREMVLTAQKLERHRDRFLMIPPAERDHKKEIDIINEHVYEESLGFFERLLGSSKSITPVTSSMTAQPDGTSSAV